MSDGPRFGAILSPARATFSGMRAAGYVRVSTARQAEEGLSLEAQRRKVAERIAAEGWELDEIYVEAGSGRKDDRPELSRLLNSLDAIDRLVIPKLDRLGRSNRHLHEIFETLEAANVELVSIGDNLDTTGAAGRFMRALLTALAELESETIGERVKAVAGGRVESGKHHGRAPFGYRGEGGQLIPVELEAAAVREIFESAAAGVSQREIARRLNAKGIRPQRAKDWTQASVGKTLRNVTYKGDVEINEQVFRGDHEAIVPPVLWDKVAQLRATATRTPGGPRGRPTIGRHVFVRGLLRCGHCNDTMVTRSARRKGGLYETYQCHGRIKYGTDHCDMEPIPREALDVSAFRYFEEVAVDVEAMHEQLREQTERGLKQARDRLKDATRRLKEVEAARESFLDQFIAKEIDASEWAAMRRELEQREEGANLDAQVAEEAVERLTAASKADIDTEASKRLAEVKAAIAGEVNNAEDIKAVRAALSRLFDRFEVFRVDRSDTSDLPSEVRALIEAQGLGPDEDTIEAGGWSILPYPTVTTLEELEMPIRMVIRREPLQLAENKESPGFDHVVVCSAGEAPDAVGLRGPPAQDDHGQLGIDARRDPVGAADPVEHHQTGAVPQLHVEYDEIRTPRLDGPHALGGAARAGDPEAVGREVVGQVGRERLVVLDDDDGGSCSVRVHVLPRPRAADLSPAGCKSPCRAVLPGGLRLNMPTPRRPRSLERTPLDTRRRGNYESGSDYVLEYGELRFTFNEDDFLQRIEQAALRLGFVCGSLDAEEQEDLVNLAVKGEVAEPASALGEHVNDAWQELAGPGERSLVHWLRRLVFRGAWLDQRVKERELDVIFDEATHTFGYAEPERGTRPIELSPEPSWAGVGYRR